MKFYCKQEDILNEISYAMDFTQQKNSLSILSNIYLETKDDILTMSRIVQESSKDLDDAMWDVIPKNHENTRGAASYQ